MHMDMDVTELPALARVNIFTDDNRTITKHVSDVSAITVESLLEFIQETELAAAVATASAAENSAEQSDAK